MEAKNKTVITVETSIHAPIEKVWKLWTTPEDIMKWNSASEDWHTPNAKNDIRTSGKFSFTMAAKDGSMSFDFGGIYSKVIPMELIEYEMEDGRKVKVEFSKNGDQTHVREEFEAETVHSVELQKAGWQSILDNFKKYTEGK